MFDQSAGPLVGIHSKLNINILPIAHWSTQSSLLFRVDQSMSAATAFTAAPHELYGCNPRTHIWGSQEETAIIMQPFVASITRPLGCTLHTGKTQNSPRTDEIRRRGSCWKILKIALRSSRGDAILRKTWHCDLHHSTSLKLFSVCGPQALSICAIAAVLVLTEASDHEVVLKRPPHYCPLLIVGILPVVPTRTGAFVRALSRQPPTCSSPASLGPCQSVAHERQAEPAGGRAPYRYCLWQWLAHLLAARVALLRPSQRVPSPFESTLW